MLDISRTEHLRKQPGGLFWLEEPFRRFPLCSDVDLSGLERLKSLALFMYNLSLSSRLNLAR